jgi:hypothetical protein
VEEVVITFIHNHRERDLRLPNQVEGEKLIIALNEWLGHEYDWGGGIHDIEYSFEQTHWFRLEKHQSLESAGIWDGAFLRLSEGASSSLKTEKEYGTAPSVKEKTEAEVSEPDSSGYAWKLID